MAVVKSKELQALDSLPADNIKSLYYTGRVRTATGTSPVAGLGSGDSVHLFDLPAGVIVLAVAWQNAALGSGIQMLVGTPSDTDKFLPATSVATAGNGLEASSSWAELTEITPVYATFVGGSVSINDQTVVSVLYVHP